jgi:hypothetical protein
MPRIKIKLTGLQHRKFTLLFHTSLIFSIAYHHQERKSKWSSTASRLKWNLKAIVKQIPDTCAGKPLKWNADLLIPRCKMTFEPFLTSLDLLHKDCLLQAS